MTKSIGNIYPIFSRVNTQVCPCTISWTIFFSVMSNNVRDLFLQKSDPSFQFRMTKEERVLSLVDN
ncbi:MAG: hypothetical protein HGB23_05785 [Chlorobiaceae bacterium]|nr:hypothetical protein [Chlorobiaceae bacterium]